MSLSRKSLVLLIGWVAGVGFAGNVQAVETNGSALRTTQDSLNESPPSSGDMTDFFVPIRPRSGRFPLGDLPARRNWHLQLAGTALLESWDKNLSSEQLYGGIVAVGYRLHERWSVNLETSIFRVVQDRDDARLSSVATTARWQFTTWNAVAFYTELGIGIAHADVAVPRRGTRFNYLLQAGVVAACPIGSSSFLIGGPRWVHISNNGREGRSRNPDLQALGGYLGLLFPF